MIGAIVCAGLLTQREADIWLRAGILLLLGLVLWAINLPDPPGGAVASRR